MNAARSNVVRRLLPPVRAKRLRLFTLRVNDHEMAEIERLGRHYGRAASDVVRDLIARELGNLENTSPLRGSGSMSLRR